MKNSGGTGATWKQQVVDDRPQYLLRCMLVVSHVDVAPTRNKECTSIVWLVEYGVPCRGEFSEVKWCNDFRR
ncbi:hypothetical protein AgCh_036375 [Apium graveolens]